MDVLAAHCVGLLTPSSTFGNGTRAFELPTVLSLRSNTARIVVLGWTQYQNGGLPPTDRHLIVQELPGGVAVTVSPDNPEALSTAGSQTEEAVILFAFDRSGLDLFSGRVAMKDNDTTATMFTRQRMQLVLLLA